MSESQFDSILLDTKGTPFTSEIDRVLLPYRDTILRIISDPSSMVSKVPALQWLQSEGHNLRQAVPYAGGLGPDDCARLNNWFSVRLKDVPERDWALCAPVAHGATLLLVSRMKADPSNAGVDECDLLQHAWMRQMDYHGKTIKGQTRPAPVDVDKEAVSFLEARMFSQSKMAGVAGNRQWGLDIRFPQSDWVPYDEGPECWKDNLRVGLDKERAVSKKSFRHALNLILF